MWDDELIDSKSKTYFLAASFSEIFTTVSTFFLSVQENFFFWSCTYILKTCAMLEMHPSVGTFILFAFFEMCNLFLYARGNMCSCQEGFFLYNLMMPIFLLLFFEHNLWWQMPSCMICWHSVQFIAVLWLATCPGENTKDIHPENYIALCGLKLLFECYLNIWTPFSFTCQFWLVNDLSGSVKNTKITICSFMQNQNNIHETSILTLFELVIRFK